VPRPGHLFVVADWSKMELCTWAQVLVSLFGWDAPSAELARVLRSGADPHSELGLVLNPADPKLGRQMAKEPNFGFPGGLGAETFVKRARKKGFQSGNEYLRTMPLEEGQRLRKLWADRWKPWAYFDFISTTAQDGVVQPVSGRVRGGCGYTDACNTFFSGLAADIAGDTLWRIACEIYAPENGYEPTDLSGCRQVLFVHDENVLEPPRAQAERCAARLKQVMERTFDRWCGDVPCKAEITIRERYGK
jgi:hypothetical protein